MPENTTASKNSAGFWFVVIVIIIVGILWYNHKLPGQHGLYTFNTHFSNSGFPDVQIDASLINPPKALSSLPSDYVQVKVTLGRMTFSTEDNEFKCLQGLVPLLFREETLYPNLLIAVYNSCGSLLQPLKAMFTIPDTPVCSKASSGSQQCLNLQNTPLSAIITNLQVASAANSNCNLPTFTSMIPVNQVVCVFFSLNPPSAAYGKAKWYLNNRLVDTLPVQSISADQRGGYVYRTYPNTGNGRVELYWCLQEDCSDARLVTQRTFTISG